MALDGLDGAGALLDDAVALLEDEAALLDVAGALMTLGLLDGPALTPALVPAEAEVLVLVFVWLGGAFLTAAAFPAALWSSILPFFYLGCGPGCQSKAQALHLHTRQLETGDERCSSPQVSTTGSTLPGELRRYALDPTANTLAFLIRQLPLQVEAYIGKQSGNQQT